MYQEIYNIQSKTSLKLRKISMMILALLPILGWYAIPFPAGLGYAIVMFLSAYIITRTGFKINVLPPLFWLLYTYIFLIQLYHCGFALNLILPPGGWQFFIFFMALIWGTLTFDLELLKKYMRWVIIVSAILFWIQFMLKLTTGSFVFCFVPNLTGGFTYEDMSYAELVAKQMIKVSDRPSSIFLEPSFMAYYFITYLAIYWFSDELKNKLYNREIILIFITLLALKSGSGMVGLAVLCLIKVIRIFLNASFSKKVLFVIITLPIMAIGIYGYVKSEAGQTMISRSEEFSEAGTSGFARVVSGYLMFGQLNEREKMIGIPEPKERFGVKRSNGGIQLYANGFQTILLTLGYIGMMWYLLFYSSLFLNVSLSSRMSIIILLVMSLLESNYLNSYMMLLTIIPCAEYYFNKKKHLQMSNQKAKIK